MSLIAISIFCCKQWFYRLSKLLILHWMFFSLEKSSTIVRQFAAGRPDCDDAKELAEFARQITAKLNSGVFGKLELAGSHGTYKEVGPMPFKPEANENCDRCGICAAGCPVGAIDKSDPRKTDKELCISCMRCQFICSKHADPVFMQVIAEKMAPKLGGHKKNYLFL